MEDTFQADGDTEKAKLLLKRAFGYEQNITGGMLGSLFTDKNEFLSSLRDTLLKKKTLNTLHTYIRGGILDFRVHVDEPRVLETAKRKYVEKGAKMIRLDYEKLEKSVNDFTFKDIQEFYYANLLDLDITNARNYTSDKMSEVKELIVQIAKRKSDEARLIEVFQARTTIKREKEVIQEKLKLNQYAMENCKEKAQTLLQFAPFTIEDIERGLLADAGGKETGVDLTIGGLKEALQAKGYQRGEVATGDGKTFDAESDRRFRRFNEEKARLARKFLGLTIVDARAVKNRLAVDTLAGLVEKYREFDHPEKRDQFFGVLKEALCGLPRAEKLVKVLATIVEIEDKYHVEQKRRAAAIVERKYLEAREDAESNIFQGSFESNVDLFFFFLPFWRTPIDHPTDRKATTLRNQFRMTSQDVENLVSITKQRTLEEIVSYYRLHRVSKEHGVFSSDEMKLMTRGKANHDIVDGLSRAIVLLAKEALAVPKFVFDYPTLDPSAEVLDLEEVTTLPLSGISAIITCVLTQPSAIRRLNFRAMGLNAEATFIFQMLLASDVLTLMSLDVSSNKIRDDGFENLLQALRANPLKRMKVLDAEDVEIGPESAVRISHYLKVTVARPTILPLAVLSLAGNSIGNIGVDTLVSFLKGQSLMRYLDLSRNKISDKGLYAIADMLRTNTSLNVLYLDGGAFGFDCVGALGLALEQNERCALISLSVGRITFTREAFGMFFINGIAKRPTIRCVQIESNYTMEDPTVRELVNKHLNRACFLHLKGKAAQTLQPSAVTLPLRRPLKEFLAEWVFIEEDERSNGIRADAKKFRIKTAVIYDPLCTSKAASVAAPRIRGLSTIVFNADRASTARLPEEVKHDSDDHFLDKNSLPTPPRRSGGATLLSELFLQRILEGELSSDKMEIVAFLVEEVISVDTELAKGDTIFHRMVEFQQVDLVKYLLQAGANPNARTSKNCANFPYATPLHIAAAVASLELCLLLIESGSTADAKDINGNTPLHYAAACGLQDVCDLLVQRGAQLEARNKKNMVPLHSVVISDSPELFEFLVRKGNFKRLSDLSKQIREKRCYKSFTAAMLALERDATKLLQHLLEVEINVNAQEDSGKTLLHLAIEMHKENYLPLILKYKANLEVRDQNGETAAMYTIRFGTLDALRLLEARGANINEANAKGDTFIHLAARENRKDVIGWLLDKGVNPFVKNAFGNTPKELTTSPELKEILGDKYRKFDLNTGQVV